MSPSILVQIFFVDITICLEELIKWTQGSCISGGYENF